jgi:hypothetical protein
MLLAIEPVGDLAALSRSGVRLLGIEPTRRGRWPALRHVFDLDRDAGLHVEVDPLARLTLYAVGYDMFGDEMLTPL